MGIALDKECHVVTVYNPYGASAGVPVLDYLHIQQYGGFVKYKSSVFVKRFLCFVQVKTKLQIHFYRNVIHDAVNVIMTSVYCDSFLPLLSRQDSHIF